MQIQKLWTDDRAVSPVVGVALLIAITVILAAVIGGVVLGLGTSSADAPQASLQFEYNVTGDEKLVITHSGGEPLDSDYVVVRGLDDDFDEGEVLSAGGSTSLNVTNDDGPEVAVVWMDANSNDEAVIATYDLPE